jgi:hypothetical protein
MVKSGADFALADAYELMLRSTVPTCCANGGHRGVEGEIARSRS